MTDQTLSAALKALSDPARRYLFERIKDEGARTVTQLTEGAGMALYSVQPEGLRPVATWLAHYTAFGRDTFDAQEQHLDENTK